MDLYVHERCQNVAITMLKRQCTIREVAKSFGIGKSTAYKDVTVRLKDISPILYTEVNRLLEQNREESSARGGMATKLKYELMRNNND